MLFHVDMSSCHGMSSCYRLTLVCVHVNIHQPMCHVKDQNPCPCVKCPSPRSRPHPSDMSVSPESGSKTPKSDQTKSHAPILARKHVGDDMSNVSFHVVMSRHVVMLETDPCVWGAFHLVRTHLEGEGGFKYPIHFHCVLHAKSGEGVQIACKIAYVLNGRPLSMPTFTDPCQRPESLPLCKVNMSTFPPLPE